MLELLKFTDRIWNFPSLKDVAVIGAQHIMESTLILFRNLKSNGLDPSQTFLIGKCYSTSASAYRDFINDGFNVSDSSFYFNSHKDYDSSYKENISRFLKESIAKIDYKKIKKLIILDDGGYLINEINSIDIPNLPIASIEQTSAGIHYLKNIYLNIPVINVARSKAKLEIETPFIVESSLKRLFQYLPQEEFTDRTVLILGYGVIGASVSEALKPICNIEIFDPRIPESRSLLESLKKADIVLGCSGTTSLKYSHYKLLKDGTILASLSSSDREFEAHHFRKLFPKTTNCLSSFNNERILLLQSGFPINFWGSRNNISLEKIQITLSLLLASVYQAIQMEETNKGIICIDEESERLIMSEFSKSIVENPQFHTELPEVKFLGMSR